MSLLKAFRFRRTYPLAWIPLIVALLPASGAAPACAREIVATVRNAQTDEPVQGAVVRLVGSAEQKVSDKHGEARFEGLEASGERLYATHVAFERSDTVAVAEAGAAAPVVILLIPRAWVIDEVVVTGTRSPHMLKDVPVETDVIGSRDFSRTGARTVDEALAWSVGAAVSKDLSGQGVALRGLDEDRVLILVDGERAVGRVRGSIDLSQFALLNVDRIEIVKGSGATLYGSEAIGGVVNIITHNPDEQPVSARLYADYGSHESSNSAVDLNHRLGKLSLAGGARFFRTKGFDLDPSTPHTNGEEAIDRLNLHLKAAVPLAPRWRLGWSGRFMTEDRNWIESEIFPPDLLFVYDDGETNRRYESSGLLEYRSGERYRMGLRLYGTYYDHRWDKNASGSGLRIDESKTDDEFYEASYSSNYVIGEGHQATYGLDWNHQNLRSSEIADDSKADRAWDGYLQYEYTPLRKLTLLPGVRYERHSSFGGHLNPSMNVMVTPAEWLKLRGYVGGGFRAPSIKEQYFIFDHTAAGYVVYGGSVPLPAELGADPERFHPIREENSVNSSISAETSYGTIGMHRLTLFYNHLEDLVDFTLLGITPTYWRGIYVYQNIGTAVTKGIEWESRIRLSEAFDLSFSYDYLHARDLDADKPLLNRPKHTVKLVFSAQDDRIGLGGSLWGDFLSRKLWVSLSNTGEQESDAIYAPAHVTLNASAFKRFGHGVEGFVRLENVLDQTNITYGYWPGRQLFAGLKYDFIRDNP